MTRLIRAELIKLRKSSLTWILLYVLMGIMIVTNLLLYMMSRIARPGHTVPGMANVQTLLGLPSSIPFALMIISSFGAVLAVILVASSIGNEYTWRTIRVALISGEGRLQFLGAKLISVAILILIGMVIGLATGLVISSITTAIGGNPFDFSFVTSTYLWNQFLQFWRTFFTILPVMLLAALFALVGRAPTPGIAIGVGAMFLEPIISSLMGLAGGWVARVPEYMFNANVNAINALNQLKIPGGFNGMLASSSQVPSVSHAFAVLSVYIVVFIGVAFALFRKRDITG